MAFLFDRVLNVDKMWFLDEPPRPYFQTQDRFVVFQRINPENSNILIHYSL